MGSRLIFWAALSWMVGVLSAADVTGNVVVTRKLTRTRVTPSASAYDRGPAVPPDGVVEDDPLAWERRHVVVYLEEGGPSPQVTAVMEQKGRAFSPDLLAISAGSKVSFPNRDVIFHNVFSLSRARAFDLGNYPRGQTREIQFRTPGVVMVNCRLHPNMAAVIVVTPNAYSAIPDASGRFEIHGVPPGNYTVVAWHKSAGTLRQKVRVPATGAGPIEFQMPLGASDASGPVARR